MKILSFNAAYRLTHKNYTSQKLKEVYDRNMKRQGTDTKILIPSDNNGIILLTGEDARVSNQYSEDSHVIANGFYCHNIDGYSALRSKAIKCIRADLEKRAIHIPLDGKVESYTGVWDNDL